MFSPQSSAALGLVTQIVYKPSRLGNRLRLNSIGVPLGDATW
jgi:hypothetical protein